MQGQTSFLQIKTRTSILFRNWHVENPKSVVCLVHDLGSHSGTFTYLVESLTKKGNAFCAIDLIGHGQSTGTRGHLNSYKMVFEEIELLLQKTREIYNDTPIVLYGQGAGGNMVLNYYFSKKIDIQGIIISSPWFKLHNPPLKIVVTLARMFQFIFPKFTCDSGYSVEKLSRDNEYLHIASKDPYRHNKISCKFFLQAFNHGKKISVQGYRLNKPMLLLHGSGDKITSYKASVEFSRNTGNFTEFKSFPNGYHELHNDIVREEVFEAVNQWIDKEVVKRKSGSDKKQGEGKNEKKSQKQ